MPEKLCFVVGPIGKAGTPVRKAADLLLKAIIRPSIEPLGFLVKRADDETDPGSISSAVIEDVLKADLVIADLTTFNPNAFYELGIRHGSRLPTIHVITEDTDLPFDNKDQRTIFIDLSDFDSMESAKDRLAAAAKRTSEPGYLVSNPVTQANAVVQLKESGDPTDELLARLDERMAKVERQLRHTPAINPGSVFGFRPSIDEDAVGVRNALLGSRMMTAAEADILQRLQSLSADSPDEENRRRKNEDGSH